ncbi:MAG: PIN domain-containing protein [Candidatus Woesearchaeota archaeon]
MSKMICLDTYAIFEIFQQNPELTGIISENFLLTEITLAELYQVMLRNQNKATAQFWYKKFNPYAVSVKMETLIKAIEFKHENKKKNISFFDAVGYMYAFENKIDFVTGDKEFKGRPFVRFIK